MQPGELEPGATALVLGAWRDRRSFCLGHLAMAERAAAIVLPADPMGVIEGYERLGGEAPLTVVTDGAVNRIPVDGPDVRTVTADADSLPSVGEAALGRLESDGPEPPADRLWIAGLPRLLERVSIQQAYRLLYILSGHVRRTCGLGLYGLEESTEPETVRVLGQALDHEITLTPESEPETRALVERSTRA